MSKLDALKIDRSQDTPRRSRRYLLWVGIILFLVVGAWWLVKPTAAQVRTAAVREVSGSAGRTVLNASGYVTARRQATVSAKTTGKVLEVRIEEGTEVKAGEILARLDDANVRAALRLAEAQLAAARSALQETRVRLADAERELRRARELVAGGVASQATLDRAQAEAESLGARLGFQEDDVGVAERQVALRTQELEDTVIRSPFAGKVITKDAQPGEMISPVSAGGGFTRTGICTIVDMDSLEIEVDVNESYIKRVEAGQPAEATLDAYPDWKIPARVIAIIPTADRDKATVRVRVGFDELDPRILPDMAVRVAFLKKDGDGSQLVVPREAVRNDGERDIVLVVREGRVERREVAVSAVETAAVQVLSGLSVGERVVVEGPTGLADGDVVEEMSR